MSEKKGRDEKAFNIRLKRRRHRIFLEQEASKKPLKMIVIASSLAILIGGTMWARDFYLKQRKAAAVAEPSFPTAEQLEDFNALLSNHGINVDKDHLETLYREVNERINNASESVRGAAGELLQTVPSVER